MWTCCLALLFFVQLFGLLTCQLETPVVHVVFMNHLDVGYNGIPQTGFIANVVNSYFDIYFPRAIATAQAMRQNSTQHDRFIYTTHSWLVSMFMDCPAGLAFHCPNASARDAFTQAVKRGDITWHAYPFNAQAEVMDALLFDYGLLMTHELDTFFGVARKQVMSQRDVPGTTRAVIPLLVRNGVKGLTIGCNGGSAPPAVPKIFLWYDQESNKDLVTMVHRGGYPNNWALSRIEDAISLPGSSHSLIFAFRTDNSGPPMPDEVYKTFDIIRRQYSPNTKVIASTLDTFIGEAIKVKSRLPVISMEIGDTWVYGVPSDPIKISQYREIVRLRSECLESGQCDLRDYAMRNMSRFLIKVPEHTWGLPGVQSKDWSNPDFYKVRNTTQFANCEQAWVEQRAYNSHAIAALGNHSLAAKIVQRLKELTPQRPDLSHFQSASPSKEYQCPAYRVRFDAASGAINSLISLKTGLNWAGPRNLVGEFVYSTFNDTNAEACCNRYHYEGWGVGTFTKPRIQAYANLQWRDWKAQTMSFYQAKSGQCVFLAHLIMDPVAHTQFGAPNDVWLQIDLTNATSRRITFELQWFGKTTTRLPESLWMAFNPVVELSGGYWTMNKLGSWLVDPQQVILNGSQHQHGVWRDVIYHSTGTTALRIHSLDAAIVSPFSRTPFPAPDMNVQYTIDGGMSYCLYNNIWDTNYILWYPYTNDARDQNQKMRFSFEEW